MLGQISGLRGRDALAHDIGGLRRRQPQRPDIIARFAVEEPGEIIRRDEACLVSVSGAIARGPRYTASQVPAETLGIKSAFAEDVRRSDNRVLRVRPCLPLETQRVVEIKCD